MNILEMGEAAGSEGEVVKCSSVENRRCTWWLTPRLQSDLYSSVITCRWAPEMMATQAIKNPLSTEVVCFLLAHNRVFSIVEQGKGRGCGSGLHLTHKHVYFCVCKISFPHRLSCYNSAWNSIQQQVFTCKTFHKVLSQGPLRWPFIVERGRVEGGISSKSTCTNLRVDCDL